VYIPAGNIERLEVELTHTQSTVFVRALDDMIRETKTKAIPIPNRLSQLSYLSQIVGNISCLGYPSESGKLIALIEIAEIGYLRPPVLIWARYRESIAGIVNVLRERTDFSVEVIDGSVPMEQRDNILDRYREGQIDILVMQIQTGKFGLNLVETKTIIYYELSFSSDDLLQSYYRVYRIGLDHDTLVLSFFCPGTVDELISTNLDQKLIDISQISQTELLDLLTTIRGNLEE
jgi:SNF2 family DNA or RNA helicase